MNKETEISSKKTAQQRIWREKHKHPCILCGKACDFRGNVCRHCFPKSRRREGHPNWKGGRVRLAGGAEGYIGILNPDHPRSGKNGYVLEHILVWEQTHAKSMPQGWIIHHLNGIKYDNRPSNLVALPNKKHYLVLQAKAKRIQELEGLLNGQIQLI